MKEITEEFLNRKTHDTGDSRVREIVLNKFGKKCAYCGCDLVKFHIDHVKPLKRHLEDVEKKGANHIDNYYPACFSCNSSKGSQTIEEFRAQIENRHDYLIKYSSEYRSMIKFFRVIKNELPVKFYFETL